MPEATAPRMATTRDFLIVVFRQLWVIVTVLMVAVVSVIIVSWRSPTNYESSSRVLVNRGRKENVLQPGLQVLPWSEELSSELETVKSFPVAQRAQAILDEWFEQRKLNRKIRLAPSGVNAGIIGESNVVEISYTTREAETCVPVVNALTQSYMEFRRQSVTIPYVNEFFARQVAEAESAMAAIMAQREAYLRETGTLAPTNERNELFGLLQTAETNLATIQQEIRINDQRLALARRHLAQESLPDPGFFSNMELGNAGSFATLKDRRQNLLLQKETLLSKQTPEHPELKGVLQALAEVEDQIRREARTALALLESRGSTLAEKERTLLSLKAGYRGQLEELPLREIRIGQLDQQLETMRSRYKELVGKDIQAKIYEATSPDWTVTLLAPASRPVALRATDYVRLALAPILSLVVGLMLAFFLDSLDHSLKSAGDVEEYLGVPVLASLPESKG